MAFSDAPTSSGSGLPPPPGATKPAARCSIECYGATRIQAGHRANEDAFVIEREPVPHAAVFDGVGNAEQAAHNAARFFKAVIKDQAVRAIDLNAWAGWVRLMDSRLMGGTQSTFVGVAVPDVDQGLVVGAYAGNSRAYIIGEDGVRLVTAESSPGRLGSGRAQGKTFMFKLRPYDILLLMSDGAWGAFGGTYLLRKAVASALARHFSEVPQAILDAATPTGEPADDMTVVALRQRRLK
jgi:Stage II sporulation protein E (SpoIIE)